MLPKDVDITTQAYSLDSIYKMVNEKTFDFTESQVKSNTNIDDSSIICAIMLRVPISDVYGYYDGNVIKIIKGNNKLCAIYNFMSDKFVYYDTSFFYELNGKKYSEFPLRYQRRIKENYVNTHIIRSGTPDDVKEYLMEKFKYI